jgi:hypothetical protein
MGMWEKERGWWWGGAIQDTHEVTGGSEREATSVNMDLCIHIRFKYGC